MNLCAIKDNRLLESQPFTEENKEIVKDNITQNMVNAGISDIEFTFSEMNDTDLSNFINAS